ncbi:MAG TPA: PAS domain S-box protein [Candidatus Acidoferrum sp.]|jgi:PAS domain S-box-containing protein|nr:PAS domain S-box protein [Candidatus Acidoferrum sp.]
MNKDSTPRADAPAEPPSAPSQRDHLSRRERGVWRSALLLLGALALAFAATSWQSIRDMSHNMEALPVGLVVLVFLFVVYAWTRANEISELRGLVRGIEQRTNAGHDATQLEQLFSLISKSQQGYRDLIDTFEDLLFSISNDGKILTVNRSCADLLNLTFADVVGRPMADFFDLPDANDRQALEQWLPRFMQRRRWTGVVRARVKQTGAIHYFDCVLHAIVRDDVVHGISGFARDVTKERESETRFTELFQTLREGVYLASADDRITEVNPALAQMLGFENQEELLNCEIASLYKKTEDRAEEHNQLKDLGFLRAHEITLKHRKDGRDVVTLHTTAAIHDPAGKFVRYQGTFVDVTEQREMERLLHREQEFVGRLMDSFPDLVIALDIEGRYTFVSPQVLDILGFRPEELIGKRMGGRTDPNDRTAMLDMFDDLIYKRLSEGQIEYRTQHKNGAWRVFRASARPLHDETGSITGVIASARDITDQQRLQQQLIQSERLAAMGQMIAGVAHELNNPLTAILGVTELLRDQSSDENATRQLDLAHRQARRAAHIVQSLLVFSRPSTPRNTLLHLPDLLLRTLQLHEHSLRSNQIHVDMSARPDLPTVLGDSNQLTQVFLNLIVNAEQAIREVRDNGTLRIRLGVVGDRVLITFQDDGVGIRRELLPRIFDPFFTTKRPGRGTGLGLSICMAIVREHNGDISAQPLPDGGSVFTVSLPVCTETVAIVEPASPPASAARVAASETSASSLSRKKILVVDDEVSILEMVADSLGARGCQVDRADSGELALDLASRNSYDVILCDLNLESGSGKLVSGFDLHDRILENLVSRSALRPFFIFMTGDLVDAAVGENANRRGNRFLQKPFRITELLALLNDLPSSVLLQPKNNL